MPGALLLCSWFREVSISFSVMDTEESMTLPVKLYPYPQKG